MLQRAVYKTTTAEYLDGALKDAAGVDDGRQHLIGSPSLVDRAEELESTEDLLEHSAADFSNFISEQGADTFELVVRFGFEKAFQLAQDGNKPIQTFWVSAPGDGFELHVCEGQQSIAVFFFVPPQEPPPPVPRDYGSDRAASRSWVYRAGDRADVRPEAPRTPFADRIVEIQVSGPYDNQY